MTNPQQPTLVEALKGLDHFNLVILSAVNHSDKGNLEGVSNALKTARAALSLAETTEGQPKGGESEPQEAFIAGWEAHENFCNGPSAAGFPDNVDDAWDLFTLTQPPQDVNPAQPHHPTPSVEAVAREVGKIVREAMKSRPGSTPSFDGHVEHYTSRILALTAQQHPALGSGCPTEGPEKGVRGSPQERPGKWVPLEPTEAMNRAGFDILELNYPFAGFNNGTEARNALYRAMIAAAPSVATEATGVDPSTSLSEPQSPPPRSQERAGGEG